MSMRTKYPPTTLLAVMSQAEVFLLTIDAFTQKVFVLPVGVPRRRRTLTGH